MNEANVSRKLRVALASLGAVAWKMSDRFHASRPDIFFASGFSTGFIEMKIWPNVPTGLQEDTLNELSAVGVETYMGQYNPSMNVLTIADWMTKDTTSFTDIRKAAEWLLKYRS